MVKLGISVLCLLSALEVSATPTTYAFTGTVTNYSAYGVSDSSKVGEHVSGTFVYTGNASSFLESFGSLFYGSYGMSHGGCDFATSNVCSAYTDVYSPIVSAFSLSTSWGDSYAAQANYSIGNDGSMVGYERVLPFQNTSLGSDTVLISSSLSTTNYFSPIEPTAYTVEQAYLGLLAKVLGNALLGNMTDFSQLPDFSSVDPSLSSLTFGYNPRTCVGTDCGNPVNLSLGASLDSLAIVPELPPQSVPEPSSFALMGLGLLALWSVSSRSLRQIVLSRTLH